MVLVADVLFLLGFLPGAFVALPRRSWRGVSLARAHVFTCPLALIQCAALLCAVAAGSFAAVGAPWLVVVLLLPGYAGVMTFLPLFAIGSHRTAYLKLALVAIGAAGLVTVNASIAGWPILLARAGAAVLGVGGAAGSAVILHVALGRLRRRLQRWRRERSELS